MDRFKFRYVYNNEIYNVSAIDFSNQTANLVRLDNKEELFIKIDIEKLIQYTGLKDRNGKLIYEGDIVRLDDELNCIAQFHKEYDIEYGRLEFILIGGHPKCPTIYMPTVAHESEIIGNVCTTPELLEGKE